MATVNDLFLEVQLSLASYATALSPGMSGRTDDTYVQTLVDAGMSRRQAEEFADSYTVLAHQTNTVEGFSATVFQRDSGYFLAIRGSEDPTTISKAGRIDWGDADFADIGMNGIAIGQATDLFTFFQELTASAGAEFYQYNYNQSTGGITSTSVIAGQSGALAGKNFTVSGHSLGGHLAIVMGRLAPAQINAVYTFNAPGFDSSVLGGPNPGEDEFFARLRRAEIANGVTSSIGTSFDTTKITNVVVPRDIVHLVGVVPGPQLGQFSEKATSNANVVGSHLVDGMTDALAIYRVFAALDANKTLQQILSFGTNVLEAEANTPGASLEGAINALGELFKTGSAVTAGNRDQLYQRVADVLTFVADPNTGEVKDEYQGLVLKDLTTAGASGTLAETDISVRYALKALNPFAISGSESIYGPHNQNGELDLYDPAKEAGLSAKWLQDRAALLSALIRYNQQDRNDQVTTGDTAFFDAEQQITLRPRTPIKGIGFAALGQALSGRQIAPESDLFGSSGNDTILGSAGRSYVEGGGGDDTITTFGGADEVHGGHGVDSILGGAGRDSLFGGWGDDRLEGGTDDDALAGGEGFDTYVYNSGDGRDEIVDSDGTGQILYEGRTLAGGQRIGQSAYQDAAGTRYTLIGKDTPAQALLIDDAIYIEGYQLGNLGITLEGEPEPAPVDDDPASTAFTYTTNERLPAELNRPGIESGLRFPLAPYLRGSNSDDLVAASQGSFWTRQGGDTVTVTTGAIFINAGADDDFVDASAATGAGTLIGGAGNDHIVGGGAGETIHGDIVSATLVSGVARIDDFIFNVAGSFHLSDGPSGADAVPAGWGMLQEYLTELQLEDSGADLSFDDVSLDVSTAGWDFGSLEGFLGYMLGDGSFDDFIDAGAGADIVIGGSGDDEIHGGDGNDSLLGDYAGGAIDYSLLATSFGALANLFGEPGDDYLDGGPGDDTVTDTVGGSDGLFGGDGADILESAEAAPFNARTAYNYLDGGEGNDVIRAHGVGNEFNVLVGGAGNDFIEFGGNAVLEGGAGDDTYWVASDFADRDSFVLIRDSEGRNALTGSGLLWSFLGPNSASEFAPIAWDYVSPPDKIVAESRREGGDLRLSWALPTFPDGVSPIVLHTRTIIVERWFADPSYRIEHYDVPGLTADVLESYGSQQGGGDEGEEFYGSDGRDRIWGGAGDDWVQAGQGDDLIAGGKGNDSLSGGAGDDTYFYGVGDGDDYIYDSSGSDELWLGPGISSADVAAVNSPFGLTLTISGGTVTIEGDSPASPAIDRFVFADGSAITYEALVGSAPFHGSDHAEAIAGNAADNTLRGGGGDDVLEGLGGSDVYHFSLGDGFDRISDLPADGEVNTIAFGPGITPDMLSLGTGSLAIRVGAEGDEIHLENVDPSDVFGSHDIEIFTFEDGSQLTYAELVARGFDLAGTPEDDVLLGSNTVDRIAGGLGDDVLFGGQGGDTYAFNAGDGSDILIEVDEAGVMDTVKFGAGIAPAALEVRRSHDHLLLGTGSAGDELMLSAWFSTAPRAVERFEFHDGTSWLAPDVESRLAAATPPPASEPSLPDQPAATPDAGPAPAPADLHEPSSQPGEQRPGETLLRSAVNAPGTSSEFPIISDEAGFAAPADAGPDGEPRDPDEAQQAAIDALFDRAQHAPVTLLDLQAVADAIAALEAYTAEAREREETRSSPRRTDPHAAHARSTDIGVTPWDISFALLQAHMERYDSSAPDHGEYVHGRIGVFGGIGIESAQELIGAARFGAEAHSLRQFAGLKEGFALLQ